jgi:hypothetical protein
VKLGVGGGRRGREGGRKEGRKEWGDGKREGGRSEGMERGREEGVGGGKEGGRKKWGQRPVAHGFVSGLWVAGRILGAPGSSMFRSALPHSCVVNPITDLGGKTFHRCHKSRRTIFAEKREVVAHKSFNKTQSATPMQKHTNLYLSLML